MYHRVSLQPVCVEKMSCPNGPSKLPDSVKVGHRISGLSVREKEGIVDLLIRYSLSILPSLKDEGCAEYGRYCKDH